MKRIISIILAVVMCLSTLVVGTVSSVSAKSTNKGLVVKYKYNYNGSKGIKNSILKGNYNINHIYSFYYKGKKISYDGKKLKCSASNVFVKKGNITFKKYGKVSLNFKYKGHIKSSSTVYVLANGSSIKKLRWSNIRYKFSKSDQDFLMKAIYTQAGGNLSNNSVKTVLIGSAILNNYRNSKLSLKESYYHYIAPPDFPVRDVPNKYKKNAKQLVNNLCKGYSDSDVIAYYYDKDYFLAKHLKYSIKYYVGDTAFFMHYHYK